MDKIKQLQQIIEQAPPLAVAVSGGVDSVTLAILVSRLRPDSRMYHARSPAVPERATRRVRDFAAKENWSLSEIVAGEFEDASYIANPYNRCFYCKMNLYAEIRKNTDRLIVSGANIDDLSDYRPGLVAAETSLADELGDSAAYTRLDVRN